MTNLKDLHISWMADPTYRDAYAALEAEFSRVRATIEARIKVGVIQEQPTQCIESSHSPISPPENGHTIS